MKTELHTDKVKLRAPERSDAASLYHLRTHPSVNKFIERNIPENISDVEKFIDLRNADPNPFYFIIETLPTNELAGAICLTHSENLSSRKLLEKSGFKLMSGKTDPDNSNNTIYSLKKA